MLRKIKVKIGKYIAKNAPINRLRIMGLKICGYKVGKMVYIGEDLLIITDLVNRNCFLEIGDCVSIAPRNVFILSSHPNKSNLINLYPPKTGRIIIKDNVWIATNCVILPGVTIGESSIIGTNTVVSEDVESFKVYKSVFNFIVKDIRRNK